MADKAQFLTELLGECYHDPIHIESKNIPNDRDEIIIRRIYKCSKCGLLMINPLNTCLNFGDGNVFLRLLEFTQTSTLDPGEDYRTFWNRFCIDSEGGFIDGVATLPQLLLNPIPFANYLCDHLMEHYPDYVQMVKDRERRRWYG